MGSSQAGGGKRTRKARLGSRAAAEARTAELKAKRAEGSRGRKHAPVVHRDQHGYVISIKQNRWPTEAALVKCHELNMVKVSRRQARKGIKPAHDTGFMILESLLGNCPATLDKLLVAASLEIKKVRRYPGMILSRTYNLKNRPIVIL